MPSMSEPYRKRTFVSKTSFAITPIETKAKCFRKWALGWIAKLPKVESPSKEFGKRAHAMAEDYLRHGSIPDLTKPEGKCFVKGVHMLPKPGTVIVEDRFKIEVDGIELDGAIDFRSYDWTHIGDHKFVASFEWYPVTADKLSINWQANVYALASVLKSHRSCANMNWLWYPKRSGQPVETNVTIPGDSSIDLVRKEILPHCRDMKAAKAFLRGVPKNNLLRVINEVIPCNALHCLDYNQLCDYSEFCER